MNRYQIALKKFPTYAETYEAVFGIKEPWEFQTGKRHLQKKGSWYFKFFSSPLRQISFSSTTDFQYPQHYIQEYLGYWTQPNRNGRIYSPRAIEQIYDSYNLIDFSLKMSSLRKETLKIL
jgi:hypothetical protein